MPYPSAVRAQPIRPPWRKSNLLIVASRRRAVHPYLLAVFLALFFFLAVFFLAAFRFFAIKKLPPFCKKAYTSDVHFVKGNFEVTAPKTALMR